jgi:hypothetical protein
MFAVQASSCFRVNFLLTTILPAKSATHQMERSFDVIDASRIYLHVDESACQKLTPDEGERQIIPFSRHLWLKTN